MPHRSKTAALHSKKNVQEKNTGEAARATRMWIGVTSESGIAGGLTPVVKTTSGHAVAQNLAHAPEGPDGNGGDVAPKLTSPLSTYCCPTGDDHDGVPGKDVAPRTCSAREDTVASTPRAFTRGEQRESLQGHGEDSPSVMEQLFPEIFGAAKRLEDVCHCGELAHRTCPCGARTCHNHFYDGEGNLARRDEQGFCGECVDLIREEAAGIERFGRTP
jgi:hypothetical protein